MRALIFALLLAIPSMALALVPGQVNLGPNAEWLQDTTGAGVLLCGAGDPEGFLYNGTLAGDGTRTGGNQTSIISALDTGGANVLYMIGWRGCPAGGGGGACGGDGDTTEMPMTCTGDGSTQCTDDADCSGVGGICDFDADIRVQWEGWFDAMDAATPPQLIYFFFYDDDSAAPSLWAEDGGTPGSVERRYLEGVVDAFEHHPRIIWNIAEEYPDEFSTADIISMATIIRAADDHNHPVGVHQPPTGGPFDFASDTELDHFAAQYSGSDTAPDSSWHSTLVSEFNASAGAASPYNFVMSEVAGGGIDTGANYRRNVWAGVMAGVGVLAHGWWVTTCGGGACQDPPPAADIAVCGDAITLFDGVQTWGLAPDDGRASGDTDYVLSDTALDVYVGYTDSYSSTMGLGTIPAGDYDIQWLDTETGTITTESAIAHAGGAWTRARAGSGTEVAVTVSPTSKAPTIASGNDWLQITPEDTSRYTFATYSEESSTSSLTGDDEPQIRAFSGMCSGGGMLLYFGGGHTGYPGNDVEIYDIDANTWTQSYQPEVCGSGACGDPDTDCGCLYGGNGVDVLTPTGKPYTEHTYDYCKWDPSAGKFMLTLESGTWYYHPAWGWELLTTEYPGESSNTGNRALLNYDAQAQGPFGQGTSQAIVTDSNRGSWEWDSAAVDWTNLGNSNPSNDSAFGIYSTYDPFRTKHIFKCVSGCLAGSNCLGWGDDFYSYDASSQTFNPLGAPAAARTVIDFDWDTANDVLVGVSSNGTTFDVHYWVPNGGGWFKQNTPVTTGPPPAGEHPSYASCGSHSPAFQYDEDTGLFWYLNGQKTGLTDPGPVELWAYKWTADPVGQTCGNDTQEGTEICDGTDLNGGTCANTYGAGSEGDVVCAGDCQSYVTTGCGPKTNETFTSACGRDTTVNCWDFEDAEGDGIYGAEEDIYYTKGGSGLDVECDSVIDGFNPNGNSNGRDALGSSLGTSLSWGTTSGNIKGTCTGDGLTRCWTDPDCSGVGGTCTKTCNYQRRVNTDSADGTYSFLSIQPNYSKDGADGESRFHFKRHGTCSIAATDCHNDGDCPGSETCDGPYTYARFGAGGEVWVRWKMKMSESMANPLHPDMPWVNGSGQNTTGTKLFMVSGITSSGDGEHTLMHVDWSGLYHLMSNSGTQPFAGGGEAYISCPRAGAQSCGDGTAADCSLRDDPSDSHPTCSAVNDLQDPCWVNQAPCRSTWELGEEWRTYQLRFIMPTKTQVCYDNDGTVGISCTTTPECSGGETCEWCSNGTIELYIDDEATPIISATDNQYAPGTDCANLQTAAYDENTTWVDGGVEGLGRLWTTFFMTGLDPEDAHEDGMVWYDNIIVSTERIPVLSETPNPAGGDTGISTKLEGGKASGAAIK